ncbi:glycosyltransferase [Thiomonas sp.]|uniref:rhamnosyltransferase WsaF family glycosyltransferase n=1 Tax=Thiomonas sp. TaxID=2047785 RepID=UPI002639C2B5|nr:glycosyltransferase [Thiomonas sp.]
MTTPYLVKINSSEINNSTEDEERVYHDFLYDLINLDSSDFVDAVVDLFGLNAPHAHQGEISALLNVSSTSNRLAALSTLLAKCATRNLKLRDGLLRQINSTNQAASDQLHEHDSLVAIRKARDITQPRKSATRLPTVALDILDENWFLRVYREQLKGCTDARDYFLENARQQHWYPLFLTEAQKKALIRLYQNNEEIRIYLESLPELNNTSELFIKYRIDRSGLFLDNWYRARYPDIRNIDDALTHYIVHGEREGRCPNPYFDPIWYARQYEIGQQPSMLLHYIDIGHHLGFQPSQLFDATVYRDLVRKGCGIVMSEDTLVLRRYIEKGAEWIDAPSYSSANPSWKISVSNLSLDSIKRSNTSFAHTLRIVLASSMALDSNTAFKSKLTEVSPPKDKCKAKPIDSSRTKDKRNSFNPHELRIMWLIPDFEKGGGGHMTIFRMIKLLALRGHRQSVLIINRSSLRDGLKARELIFRDFFVSNIEVNYFDELKDEDLDTPDVVVATSFETVASAMRINALRHFYFVQDYEPNFHPAGSLALLAENTYKVDIDCICASPWLKQKMEYHGRWATSFYLGVDNDIYFPNSSDHGNRTTGLPRIVLYGRAFTARRCVELAIAALIRLAESGVMFHVDIIHGDSLPDELTLPFSNARYATLSPHELADLYRKGTIGIVFSATNYSLMPQEMLACGLEVVDIITESTTGTYPNSVVHLVEPDPLVIANKLHALIKGDRDGVRRDAIEKWLRHSWEDACDVVYSAFVERLDATGASRKLNAKTESFLHSTHPKVSVVIPVYNGMRELPLLMQRLQLQRVPWSFEIIVIDSSSSDGSYEFLKQQAEIRLFRIAKHEFGHGRTRNMGCELAKGEFVAFLTQDAYPVGPYWLYDLVTSLEVHPDAAGVFGRHIAHSNASPFTKRDIDDFFAQFYNGPQVISITTEWSNYGISNSKAAEYLRYYSDNNSCLRRKVWEEFPYPDVEYGEDQIWAHQVCLAGFSKVYAHQAVVAHSHDYDAQQTFKRAKIEAEFFLRYFGIEVIDPACTGPVLERLISDINASDERWGQENGIDVDLIVERFKVNENRIRGYLAGVQAERARKRSLDVRTLRNGLSYVRAAPENHERMVHGNIQPKS